MKINFGIKLLALMVAATSFIYCNSPKNAMQTTADRDVISSSDAPLQETHWKVVELMGKKIPDSATNKEMYIVLRKEQNRVEGNGGCNAIAGSYTLSKNNQIAFSQMISTKMMCPGIKYEDEFLKSLASADHYYLKADTLSLTHGKILQVVKFIAEK